MRSADSHLLKSENHPAAGPPVRRRGLNISRFRVLGDSRVSPDGGFPPSLREPRGSLGGAVPSEELREAGGELRVCGGRVREPRGWRGRRRSEPGCGSDYCR